MTKTFNKRIANTKLSILTAIMSGALALSAATHYAQAQGMENNGVGMVGPSLMLKSGRYCTQNATAALQISNTSASVSITGQYPDQRGFSGNPRQGFSGEGFAIAPVSKKTIRITQHQYGVTRNFKRC